MSLSAYMEYKDSGIEWVDDIPSLWEHGPLRWLALRYSGGTPDKKNESYWTDGIVPWLNSGAVNQGLISEASAYITQSALDQSSAKWVPENSILMALAGQGKTKGMVGQLSFRATCNQSMAAIVPTKNLNARYLYWWLTSNYLNIRNMAGGDHRDGLNLELIATIPVPLPSALEQKTIAAFLDHETGKIDALVEEKKRLIVLLKEKRQAVISHAVTKGLNRSLPMKDSGIEWLGEVPEHWKVTRVKRISTLVGRIGYRGYTTADLVDEGEGAISLSPSNLVEGRLNLNKRTYLSWQKFYESPEIEIKNNDVVMVKTGSTFGKVGIIDVNDLPSSTINPQLVIFKGIWCEPYFLYFSLTVPYMLAEIAVNNSGSTIPTMSQENIGNFGIPMPPRHEQNSIVQHLKQYSEKLDGLIAQAETAILLLRERRSALISAAVTGKIDVRDFTFNQTETEQ